MYDYVVVELLVLIEVYFFVINKKVIVGYFMGGYGVLMIVFKNFKQYVSVSVFSLIVNLMNCFWGEKVFSNYFGSDKVNWFEYDSCELMKKVIVDDYLLMCID